MLNTQRIKLVLLVLEAVLLKAQNLLDVTIVLDEGR